jgi:predicted DsbA family dithiol-disulfide isomerase
VESWCVGYDGNGDVERHAGIGPAHPEVSKDAPFRPGLKLTVVSDYICPWCYIGFTRIERLRSEFDIDLEACAYDLRPGTPPEGISRAEASKGRVYPPGYLENLRQMALDCGLDMKRPPLIPNTRLAHEATEFAREQGKLWEAHRALFAAYFEEERDLGDIEVVCDVGAAIGLDASALREALSSHRYAAEVQRQMDWSRAGGISGVPTVIFNGRFSLVGAQDYEVVRDVASRLLKLAESGSA